MDIFKKYIPVGLVCLYIAKLIYVGADYADVGIIFALVGYSAFVDYLEKHPKLKEMGTVVNKQNEVIAKMATEIDALKTSIVGVKMGQNFKQTYKGTP